MAIMPMYFLSGALFPVAGLPQWLAILNRLDPLTYAVDPMRRAGVARLKTNALARPRPRAPLCGRSDAQGGVRAPEDQRRRPPRPRPRRHLVGLAGAGPRGGGRRRAARPGDADDRNRPVQPRGVSVVRPPGALPAP